MKAATDQQRPDLETLAAVISRSQIVVAQIGVAGVLARRAESRRLPDGFDQVDFVILDWIAAEGRRASRHFARI